jgi:hypothetical protein
MTYETLPEAEVSPELFLLSPILHSLCPGCAAPLKPELVSVDQRCVLCGAVVLWPCPEVI